MSGKLLICLVVAFSPLVLCLTSQERADIANSHNQYRANVQPTASNMYQMTYYDPAEKTAQSWASQCKRLQHDDGSNRSDAKYGYCGQNILVSSAPVAWNSTVKAWYSEVSKFTYGSSSNVFAQVGHYTQVVWATTHKIGCGYAKCTDANGVFHNYVCNYCPGGNYANMINTPYKLGAKCSACPNSCLPNGLCIAY